VKLELPRPLNIALLIATTCLMAAPATGAVKWDEKTYNPKPAADDVVLPMPCDGAMVFRKVFIPTSGPLEDYPIVLGQDGTDWGYIEQARPTHIAGSFSGSDKAKSRYYLLAKYEITQLQYQALTSASCPEPSNKLRYPQTNVSWHAAVDAADRYNQWLRKNTPQALPKEDNVSGFVRLPTETEWEYAARGGIAVSSAEFRDSLYPMPKGLNNYEWFSGTQSANGRIQLAGQLDPNPLGLHDMLGNADEMIFDSFHLNKLDRQHGQAGGFVVRGGNYTTPQAEIHTAARSERAYYSPADGSSTRAKTTGFRLALVATTLTSRGRVQAIEDAWNKLGHEPTAEATQAQQGTVTQLNELASKVQDKALQEKLKALESQLRASNQRQEEARDQAIRASLNLGAFLCTKLKDDGLYVDFLEKNYQMTCEADDQNSNCANRKAKLAEQHDRLLKLGRYYASSLIDSSTLYGQKLLERQVPIFEEIISRNTHLHELKPYLLAHWRNQQAYLKTSKVDIEPWLTICKAVNK